MAHRVFDFRKLLNHPILSPEQERTLFSELKSAQRSWIETTMHVGLAAFRVAQIGMGGVCSSAPQTMIRRSFNQEPSRVIESAGSVVPEVYELVYSNRALLENSPDYTPALVRLVEKNTLAHSSALVPWNAAIQTLENRLDGEEHIPGLMQYASKIQGLKSKSALYRALATELGIVPEAFSDLLKDILKYRETYYQKREEAMLFNQRLVFSHAKRLEWKVGTTYLSLADLHSVGNTGLMKGIERFDVDKGYKFSTYGLWWIQHAIRRELQNTTSAVRIPIHVQERLKVIHDAIRRLYQEHREDGDRTVPTLEEISESTGFDEEVIKRTLNTGKSRFYLDAPLVVGEDNTAHSIIPDDSQLAPYEFAHQNSVGENIGNALATLSPQLQQIIRLRFGFDGGETHTLEEIGDKYGVTRERIRQLEARALKKLRHPTRMKLLRIGSEDLKE